MRLSRYSITAIVFCVLAICGYFFRDAVGVFVFKSYTGLGLEHHQYMFLIVPLAIILLLVGLDYAKAGYLSKDFPINIEALKILSISTVIWVGCGCSATIIGMFGTEKLGGLINIFVLAIFLTTTLMLIEHYLVFTMRNDIKRYKPNTISIAITIVVAVGGYMVLSAYRLTDKASDFAAAIVLPLFAFSVMFTNAFKSGKMMLPKILASLSFLSVSAGEYFNIFAKTNSYYVPIVSVAIAIALLIVALDLAKEIAKTQPITDNLDQQKSIP